MSHNRNLIRNAVVARLVAQIPSLATKIFPNRIRPLFQSSLPCILVYTLKEPVEISIEAPREYKRSLQLVVEIAAKADASLDDTLDTLCASVETAIFEGDETFGGLVWDTFLTDTEVSILADGEKLIGTARITLEMPYFQRLPGDTFADGNDDLNTIDTKIDVGSDGAIESEDTLDLT